MEYLLLAVKRIHLLSIGCWRVTSHAWNIAFLSPYFDWSSESVFVPSSSFVSQKHTYRTKSKSPLKQIFSKKWKKKLGVIIVVVVSIHFFFNSDFFLSFSKFFNKNLFFFFFCGRCKIMTAFLHVTLVSDAFFLIHITILSSVLFRKSPPLLAYGAVNVIVYFSVAF